MGGVQTSVRATWRIANLTTRDLYGQDPTLHIERGTEMPGKDTKCWLGEVQEGGTPSWGPRSGPAAEQPLNS
jgi:hypothetical protein